LKNGGGQALTKKGRGVSKKGSLERWKRNFCSLILKQQLQTRLVDSADDSEMPILGNAGQKETMGGESTGLEGDRAQKNFFRLVIASHTEKK